MFFNGTGNLYEWQRAHLSYHASNYITDEPLKVKIAMESIKKTALNKLHAEIADQGLYEEFKNIVETLAKNYVLIDPFETSRLALIQMKCSP